MIICHLWEYLFYESGNVLPTVEGLVASIGGLCSQNNLNSSQGLDFVNNEEMEGFKSISGTKELLRFNFSILILKGFRARIGVFLIVFKYSELIAHMRRFLSC